MAALGGRALVRRFVVRAIMLAAVAFSVDRFPGAVMRGLAKSRDDARHAAQRDRHEQDHQDDFRQPSHAENRITGIHPLTAARGNSSRSS